MPIYEYACEKCGNEFELLVRGKEKAACPKCKSVKLERKLSLPAIKSETTHALAGLRAEHETLRVEYERVSRELRERCHTAEDRQQLAVQELETLLVRLRQ